VIGAGGLEHALPGFALTGLAVGVAVGATGVGGGSLMTPLLIILFGVNALTAVGTDLLYATITKSFGVLLHGRNRSVDWSVVGWQALGSVPAALVTVTFLHRLGHRPEFARSITLVLAAAVLATACVMLLRRGPADRDARDHGPAAAPARSRALTGTAGALIGTLVTISSVGAGVIGMVVLMWLYPRIAPVRIIGSDLTHSVLITAIAGLGHIGLGSVDYPMLGALLIGGIPGIWFGSKIGFGMNPAILRHSVAATLIVSGVTTLAKALHH
jgi:uncharacterized protein